MFKRTHRLIVAMCLAHSMLLTPFVNIFARALTAPAPRQQQQQKQEKPKKDAKETKENKEAARAAKQEREYQKIKKFSDEQYASNADFRNEVDETYKQLQREHSEYAFDINTRDSDDAQIVRTEDKLKISDTLYDNPLVQDYVNRVGQSVVPQNSTKLYGFKVTLNPVPEARSLSTGTIYVSSGLLSHVDNEAQLAYVLGHEIVHVEKEHWREDALVARGITSYNEKQAQKRALIGGLMSAGVGIISGGISSSFSTGVGAAVLSNSLIMPNILKFVVRNATVSWDKAQEDEADANGLRLMLERNYDPREVPKFYASLQRTAQRDARVGLGFMGNLARVTERVEQVNNVVGTLGVLVTGNANLYAGASVVRLTATGIKAGVGASGEQKTLSNATPDSTPGKSLNAERDAAGRAQIADAAINNQLAADIKIKLDAGELIGSTAEFQSVMAELKRDNGIRAYYYDMFQMARDNLEESIAIRSNDAYSHLYYGKVLKLTARHAGEKRAALAEFVRAIELDKRRVVSEARLFRALAMMQDKNPAQMAEIVNNLKDYVVIYQREHSGKLPPNMDVIYDYMQEAGDLTWSAAPVGNVTQVTPIIGGNARPVAASMPDAAPPATTPATSPRTAGRRRP